MSCVRANLMAYLVRLRLTSSSSFALCNWKAIREEKRGEERGGARRRGADRRLEERGGSTAEQRWR